MTALCVERPTHFNIHAVLSRKTNRVPRTTVVARVQEALYMTAYNSTFCRIFVPRAAVFARVSEAIQMAA